MNITKESLVSIIKEELGNVLSERLARADDELFTIDEKWDFWRGERNREWENAIVKSLFGDNEPSKRVYGFPENKSFRHGTKKISGMFFSELTKREFAKEHANIWKPGSNDVGSYDEVIPFVRRLANAFFLQDQVNLQDGARLKLDQASPSMRAKVEQDLERAKQRSIGMIISLEDAQQQAAQQQADQRASDSGDRDKAIKDFMKVFKFWNGEDESISKIGGNAPQPITAIIQGAFNVEDKVARQIGFTILNTLVAKAKPTFKNGSSYTGERFGQSDFMKMLADFVTGDVTIGTAENLEWKEGEFEKYVLGVLNNIADRKPELEKRRKQQQEPEVERPSLRQRFSRFLGRS